MTLGDCVQRYAVVLYAVAATSLGLTCDVNVNCDCCLDGGLSCNAANNFDCVGPCKNGNWGRRCKSKCPAECTSCNKNFGQTNECFECVVGSYGLNCNKTCPSCKSCEKDTGECISCSDSQLCCTANVNCVSCSSQAECSQCTSGTYGLLCNNTCPVNCNGSCDKTSGNCEKCKINYFGPNCERVCSETCVPLDISISSCNTGNGYCEFGCKPGYYGDMCNFSCSQQCNGSCNQQYGECKVCAYKRYGRFCEHVCNKACVRSVNETVCSRNDGRCSHGCLIGIFGDKCDKNCSLGCRDRSCNSSTGHCSNGCADGFIGLFCETEHTASDFSRSFGVGLSLGIAASIVIGVIGGAFVFRKRIFNKFKRDVTSSPSTNTYDDLRADLRARDTAYTSVSYDNSQPDPESHMYVNTTIEQTSSSNREIEEQR